MENRFSEKIKGIDYGKMPLDRDLDWLCSSPNNALNESGQSNVIRFLLRQVRELSEQIKGLKDFYYGFDVVTEPNVDLNLPKIGWEKGEFHFKEDSSHYYYMNGYSEDGREWRGSAIYCLDDLVQYPLEDGWFEEVTK